jgi:hypothetical protein
MELELNLNGNFRSPSENVQTCKDVRCKMFDKKVPSAFGNFANSIRISNADPQYDYASTPFLPMI